MQLRVGFFKETLSFLNRRPAGHRPVSLNEDHLRSLKTFRGSHRKHQVRSLYEGPRLLHENSQVLLFKLERKTKYS